MLAILLTMGLAAAPPVPPPAFDGATIERLTGAKGALDPKSGVFKVGIPRKDLRETIAGVKFTPAEGLGSWAAFTHVGDQTMVMGDLTLTAEQVNPVMSAALDAGLQVTALHNHFLWDDPRVMFMHIGGMGATDALATAVGKVFAEMKATQDGKAKAPVAHIDGHKSKIDPAEIDAVLKHPGTLNAGVYKVVWPRQTQVHGVTMGGAMGVATWAAFAGTDAHAVVDGDFAMHEDELQGVLKALRHAGINVVAIHQHMIEESPRILFLHFWGVGKASDLATGLAAALANTQAP